MTGVQTCALPIWGEQVPYHLYALSNFGSLAGLVSYPFLIEPAIGLGAQRWIIHAGIAAVTALIGTAIALEPATDGVSGAAAAPESEPETTRGQDRLAWVGLSLLTCLTMLGATELLAAELGSSPLAWVGPFAVYLLRDRKSTRLNSSHMSESRMPSSA